MLTSLPSVSRLSRKCASPNVSQPYGPPQPLVIHNNDPEQPLPTYYIATLDR
jgi:hypothetical protein